MKCELNPNIESISGRVGNVLYKTYKRPDGKTETRAYLLPRKDDGSFGYERKTPLSSNELAARGRFAQASAYLNNLSDEQKHRYSKEFSRNNYTFNGKRYSTVRGYIIARFYAGEIIP